MRRLVILLASRPSAVSQNAIVVCHLTSRTASRRADERETVEMGWEAVTAIATAFTGFVILVTAIVGVYQLRQLREQRRDSSAIELMHSLQDTTFAQAFRVVLSLPAEMSASELRARGTDFEEAATILAFRFETLGLLVYRGAISFEVMEELVGGAVLEIWNRLKEPIRDIRAENDWPMYCEWFQWLAEQFEKRGRLQQSPAHIRLSDWTPPR